jgi:hypothetical protein
VVDDAELECRIHSATVSEDEIRLKNFRQVLPALKIIRRLKLELKNRHQIRAKARSMDTLALRVLLSFSHSCITNYILRITTMLGAVLNCADILLAQCEPELY